MWNNCFARGLSIIQVELVGEMKVLYERRARGADVTQARMQAIYYIVYLSKEYESNSFEENCEWPRRVSSAG